MLEDEYTLYIYTDGSCFYADQRRGGVGIVFVYAGEDGEQQVYELPALGYRGSSSVEMELQACVLALGEARTNARFARSRNVVIRTDSQFLVDNYARAEFGWSRKDKWKKKSGEPVALVPRWKEFLKAKRKLGKPVELQKVKGHDKDPFNKLADQRAKQSAKMAVNPPLHVVQVGRKYSDKPTIKGCVKIRGQVLLIHIIQRVYEEEHEIDRYRYEVFDQEKRKFDDVDWIYSATHLKRCHTYEVRVNSNQDFPHVVEVIGDVKNPIA